MGIQQFVNKKLVRTGVFDAPMFASEQTSATRPAQADRRHALIDIAQGE